MACLYKQIPSNELFLFFRLSASLNACMTSLFTSLIVWKHAEIWQHNFARFSALSKTTCWLSKCPNTTCHGRCILFCTIVLNYEKQVTNSGFNKFLHKWVLKSNRRVYLPKAQRGFDPRGVRGHAPPKNLEVLDSRRCIFMHFQVYFFAPKSTKNEA